MPALVVLISICKKAESLSGYRLKENSPALNAGKVIQNNGGKNLGGEPVAPGSINIGAW